MGRDRPRILFVAMSASVHAAHWIRQLKGTNWDVHLYPCEKPGFIHPDFAEITIHDIGLFRPVGLASTIQVGGLWPFRRGAFMASQICKRAGLDGGVRSARLARLIRSLRPNVVHSLEMQHSAYLTLQARNRLGSHFPAWIYSSWGSDLYYFGQQEAHREKIRAVLSGCDYHISDCNRDLRLAREFGFNGVSLGVFPGPGGYPISAMRKLADGVTSKRKLIIVKGQDHWAGRALIALEAIHRCADVLSEYKVCVYYTTPGVAEVVRHIHRMTGMNIRALKGQRPHDEIITLMGQTRVALALAVTDGTPNSMLEAMIMGAFPIQSDTGATGEWIEDGRNGFMVQSEDVAGVEVALRRALSDDVLVDSAAVINRRLTDECIDESVVRPRVIEAYKRVLRSA